MVPPSGERMLLVINVGNSNTVLATFHGQALDSPCRIPTDSRRMAAEYIVILESFFRLRGLDPNHLDGTVICSVVPAVTEQVREATRAYFSVEPLLVTHSMDLGIGMGYATPERLGADRIANAVAAVELLGLPAIAIDVGTAITINVVSPSGIFLGGAIAPGPATAVRALTQATAQLPPVPLHPPERAIGLDTASCIQSGVIFGSAALIDGLVSRVQDEVGCDVPAVATGGLADIVAPHARSIEIIDRNLTLTGMRILYDLAEKAHAHFRPG